MNNAQRALIIAAGLFLTIALISLVVNLFDSAAQGGKKAQEDFASIQTEVSAQAFVTYDNTTLTGSQVLNAIRKYEKKESFGIYVQTGKHQWNTADGVWYNNYVVTVGGTSNPNYGNIIKGQANGSIERATDEYEEDYINPNGSFTSELIYNKNQQIVGIKFIQK